MLNQFLDFANTFPLQLIQFNSCYFVLKLFGNFLHHVVLLDYLEPFAHLSLLSVLFQSYRCLFLPSMPNKIPFMEVHHIFFEFFVQRYFAPFFINFWPIMSCSIYVVFTVFLVNEPIISSYLYVPLNKVNRFLVPFFFRRELTICLWWSCGNASLFASIECWSSCILFPRSNFLFVFSNFLVPFRDCLTIQAIVLYMSVDLALKLISHLGLYISTRLQPFSTILHLVFFDEVCRNIEMTAVIREELS